MDARIVADTDVIIDYFSRGHRAAASRVRELLESDTLVVTTITLFELGCGVRSRDQEEDIGQLARAAASVLEIDHPSATEAARIYRELKSRGQTIATPDLLIAGCCLVHALPLLTRNVADFSRIRGLVLA